MVKESAKADFIHLKLPATLPQVEVDARHMVQALGRLLDNAIKFNSKHGKIWVRAAQHEDDEAWGQVEDTGIGIPEVKMDKVFNRFYQVDSATNRQYRGRIWAESNTDNPGATFTLALPIISEEREGAENATEVDG